MSFLENLRIRRERLKFTCELLFSIYLSIVVFAVEEQRDLSWSTQFRLWYFAHRYPNAPKPIDSPDFERIVAFLLAWLLMIVLLVLLRFLNRIAAASIALQWLVGFTALAGLPSALLCAGYGNRKLLLALIGLSGLVAYIYVFRRPRVSDWVSLLFLCLYFIFTTWVAWRSWSTFPVAIFMLWPGLDWILGTYPVAKNLFPLIGFFLSATWLMWVTATRGQEVGKSA
jgi:hypothetical protein